eukprot:2968263-Alexandrium_andersonii.AAC.1
MATLCSRSLRALRASSAGALPAAGWPLLTRLLPSGGFRGGRRRRARATWRGSLACGWAAPREG